MNIGTTPISFNGIYIKSDKNDNILDTGTFDNDSEVIDLIQKKIDDNGKIRNPALSSQKGTKEPSRAEFILNDRFEITATQTNGVDTVRYSLDIVSRDTSQNIHRIALNEDGSDTTPIAKKLKTFVEFLLAKTADAFINQQDKKNHTVVDVLTDEASTMKVEDRKCITNLAEKLGRKSFINA